MIVRLILIALLTGLAMPARASEPLARAEVVTKGQIIAGQRIEVVFSILVPSFFKAAPDFPLFDMDKAIVVLPDTRAMNISEAVGDVQYSGIQRRYAIIPQAAGNYRLPDIKIAVAFAADDGQLAKATVTLPPITFSVAPVPGSWSGQQPFVATNVALTQTLDLNPAKLKAGDTLVRRITVTADDTRSMMIPALDADTIAGVRLYRRDPVLQDEVTDGDRTDASRRVETLTYLVEKPGVLVLPRVELKWLAPASGEIQTASVSKIKLTVAAAPANQAIAPPPADDAAARTARWNAIYRELARIAGLVLAIALALAVLYFAGGRLRAFLVRTREKYRQSEVHQFRVAEKALSGSDAKTALQALDRWCLSLEFRSVDAWARSTGNVELQGHVTALQRALYGRPGSASPDQPLREIARLIPDMRRKNLASLGELATAQTALPPLNP